MQDMQFGMILEGIYLLQNPIINLILKGNGHKHQTTLYWLIAETLFFVKKMGNK